MLLRLINTVKTHPKKTIALTGVASLCGTYFYKKYQIELLRRSYCSKTSALSYQILPQNQSLYRVTVFLNPFAYQRSLLESFNKNAAPLLQISGLDVQMVYLDDDNEAKSFSNILDPNSTDAVVVAGDDNLLAKVITGFLRRNDFVSSRLWDMPIYVLPLGIFNNFAKMYSYDGNIVKWCYELVNPILNKKYSRRNVIELKPLTDASETAQTEAPLTETPKSVFAMTGVEWSCWRDVEFGGGGLSLTVARPSSHKARLAADDWWFSPGQLYKRTSTLFRLTWKWIRAPALPLVAQGDGFYQPPPLPSNFDVKKRKPVRRAFAKQAKLIITPVCSGCPKCYAIKNRLATSQLPSTPVRQASRFGRFFGFSSYGGNSNKYGSFTNVKVKQQEEEKIQENSRCGQETVLLLPRASRIAFVLDEENIRVNVSPASKGLLDYLHGMFHDLSAPAYYSNAAYYPHISFSSQSDPRVVGADEHISVVCSSVKIFPARTDGEFFWIDNDSFEACPMELTVLKNAVNTLPITRQKATTTAGEL